MSKLIIKNKPYDDADAIYDVSNYIVNYSKTLGLIGGNGILEDYVPQTMSFVNNYYGIYNGKLIQHFILSFGKDENISPTQAENIARLVCNYFCEYTMVYGVHQDTDELHIHFGLNPINIKTLRKFNFTNKESCALLCEINNILSVFNLACSMTMK